MIQQFLMKYAPNLLEYTASLGMRNMIINIMMLDELSHEIDAMIFYTRIFVLMYNMIIDKLNYEIDIMTLNMKMYIFIYKLIIFVNI